jgi:hypothetical protein
VSLHAHFACRGPTTTPKSRTVGSKKGRTEPHRSLARAPRGSARPPRGRSLQNSMAPFSDRPPRAARRDATRTAAATGRQCCSPRPAPGPWAAGASAPTSRGWSPRRRKPTGRHTRRELRVLGYHLLLGGAAGAALQSSHAIHFTASATAARVSAASWQASPHSTGRPSPGTSAKL